MNLKHFFFVSLLAVSYACCAGEPPAAETVPITTPVPAPGSESIKQPFFLMCPHKPDYGSWSLYLVVDKNDPSKVLSLGLEEIPLHNSKVDGYLKVLALQHDPSQATNHVADLDAADFGRKQLHVVKDDALKIDVTPDGEDYQLKISLRVSLNGRYDLGGKKGNRISLKFDKAQKIWELYATDLVNTAGKNIAAAKPVLLTGFAFPVTTFGIYRLAAVMPGGTPVLLFDRE